MGILYLKRVIIRGYKDVNRNKLNGGSTRRFHAARRERG
jgi:hypothetical protein